MRAVALSIGFAYLAVSALGIYLIIDGRAAAGETILVAAMAGGWFGSRWIAKRARDRPDE